MSDVILARALHVLGVVLWIGGVAMVTTVLLPVSAGRAALFEQVERRFAGQARWSTLATGLTGFYMAWRLDLWARFAEPRFWWMHAMVAVWALFTLMLFVLEPLVLHRWFAVRARRAPEATLALVQRMHWALLVLTLVTVAGAVAGSHGG